MELYIYTDIINTSAEKLFSRQCIFEKPGVYPNPSTEEDKNNSHKEEWSNQANIPSPEQDGWGEGEVRDWDELSLSPEQDHLWHRSRACLLEIKDILSWRKVLLCFSKGWKLFRSSINILLRRRKIMLKLMLRIWRNWTLTWRQEKAGSRS